jgi:hypothetical protein
MLSFKNRCCLGFLDSLRTKTGIPDFLLKTKTGKIVGYVEAKDPMIDKLINEWRKEKQLALI